MKKLALCYKYYMNPKMLAAQYEMWASYPDELKEKIEIIVVDDGSPGTAAADVPRPDGLPELRIYRVKEDKPWHQNGATNLSAFVAQAQWLLLTDMDHMVNHRLLRYCIEHDFKGRVFMFDRVDAPLMQPSLDKKGRPKPHPNSYLITKKFYWEVGGHDEWYCGLYGTDRLLRNRIRQVSEIKTIDVPIIRYGREVIDDASTTTLPRKENRNPNFLDKALARKLREMDADKILTLQFEWEQVL